MVKVLANSIKISRESFRVTALPMLVFWLVAVLLSGAYCLFPKYVLLLEPLRKWLCVWGWLGALLVAVFFCGILPGVFQILLPTLRPRRVLLTILVQTILFGIEGVLCYEFYLLQSNWFGCELSFLTLLKKMLVDQFIWTPIVIVPLNATIFFYLTRDFSMVRIRQEWPESWLKKIFFPNLFSHWCVNVIPNFMLYIFPPTLQIQMAGLLCAFWTLMCFQVARRSGLVIK